MAAKAATTVKLPRRLLAGSQQEYERYLESRGRAGDVEPSRSRSMVMKPGVTQHTHSYAYYAMYPYTGHVTRWVKPQRS